MAKSRKGLIVAAVAFAQTPQGKKLIAQARQYLSRPETRQKGLQLLEQVKVQAKAWSTARSDAKVAPTSKSYRVVRGTTKPDS